MNFVGILIYYVFENKRKPNDRVGPVMPKIYEKSIKAVRRLYFMSLLNSRACRPLVSKWVRRHRAALPSLRIVHWAKTSPDQAGQLLSNQSFSFLIWEQIYPTFLFLVNLYRQAFAGVFLPCSFILFEYLFVFYSNLYLLYSI